MVFIGNDLFMENTWHANTDFLVHPNGSHCDVILFDYIPCDFSIDSSFSGYLFWCIFCSGLLQNASEFWMKFFPTVLCSFFWVYHFCCINLKWRVYGVYVEFFFDSSTDVFIFIINYLKYIHFQDWILKNCTACMQNEKKNRQTRKNERHRFPRSMLNASSSPGSSRTTNALHIYINIYIYIENLFCV